MSDAAWQKRQAVHIVAQLPENIEDALAVLEYARDLVASWLGCATARSPGAAAPARLFLVEPLPKLGQACIEGDGEATGVLPPDPAFRKAGNLGD